MTDLELAAKKLAEIETYVQELRTLGRPALIEMFTLLAARGYVPKG